VSFEEDLKYGEEVEYLVLDKIKTKYPQAYKIEGYLKDWDIYIPEKEIGVEVKADRMSKKTGNVAIECSYGNEPSGIKATKASWWVYVTEDKYYWIKPEAIEECVFLENIEAIEFPPIKGDFKGKELFLIKEKTFAEYASHIENKDA